MFYGPSAPPITMGPDHLPHCAKCADEMHLCNFHRLQVEAALKSLVSQYLLASATTDLRFVIRNKAREAET